MVEDLPHHPKDEGLSPATAAGTRGEKLPKKSTTVSEWFVIFTPLVLALAAGLKPSALV